MNNLWISLIFIINQKIIFYPTVYFQVWISVDSLFGVFPFL
jgi:hypothetical protein